MQDELTQGTPVRYWPGFRDGASKLVAGAGFISGGHIDALPLDGGVIEVATGREALEVCGWEGVTDVVVTDNAERLKLEKLMRGLR